MEENHRYQELASKWLNHTISEEEKEEFVTWYNSGQDKEILIDSEFGEHEEAYRKYLLERINERIGASKKKNRILSNNKKRILFIAAAAVLSIVVIGVFFRNNEKAVIAPSIAMDCDTTNNDITPVEKEAVLTLASGRTIKLDDISMGARVEEEGMVVNKLAEDVISYYFKGEKTNTINQVAYNILRIPFGKQYQLILPDESSVWVNAGSQLSFPVQFNTKERRVNLKGEAYFEIKSKPRKDNIPFIVATRMQKVFVLGTTFNIKAYDDEKAVRTTLVNGAVKVQRSDMDAFALLKPNEQAKVSVLEPEVSVERVNATEVVSWKDGYFSFNGADIRNVMADFARWYNVEVVYEKKHFPDRFVGKIPRSLSLANAMDVLKTVGIKYTIDGKKLIIKN